MVYTLPASTGPLYRPYKMRATAGMGVARASGILKLALALDSYSTAKIQIPPATVTH